MKSQLFRHSSCCIPILYPIYILSNPQNILWKPHESHETPVKTLWKVREKPEKSGLCKKNTKRMALQFVTIFFQECSLSLWLLPISRCGIIYCVQCMSFLRPLVIQVLYSNGRVKPVLWTDWASQDKRNRTVHDGHLHLDKDRGPHCVQACAVEMHMNISLSARILRKNASPQSRRTLRASLRIRNAFQLV